ncbi:MAG TPA: hypothetical protein VGD50_02840 [Candidatus Baltobacteraceae bacterium]
MIARPLPIVPPPSRSVAAPGMNPGTRAGRTAVTRRRTVSTRRRYRSLIGVCSAIFLATACVMVWLLLVSSVTRMSYELAQVSRQRAALQDQTTRLDDTIAQLESRDRLAAVAASLGMSDPREFAVVRLPEAARSEEPARGLAFLSAIAAWIK